MCRSGRGVPKAELLAHVWDFAFDGDANVRRGPHLDPAPQDRRARPGRHPETVRGAGYRGGG